MLYVVVGIILIILIYVFIMYNAFVRIDNKVEEAFSTMDIYLKKRWDLVPNLVETVKGYATYESQTLREITNLRKINYEALSYKERLNTSNKINAYIGKIMAIA